MKRIHWLTPLGMRAIHDELIAHYGGTAGIRDAGLLEAALTRPEHLATYAPDARIPHFAAAYAWGILRNHPFVDGNKRVALAALVVFLEINGYELHCSEAEETAMILRAAAGEIKEPHWIAWVKKNCRPCRKTST